MTRQGVEVTCAGLGSMLRIRWPDGVEADYRIVAADEADPTVGRIAVTTPLAEAVVGHRAGETVIIRASEPQQVVIVSVGNDDGAATNASQTGQRLRRTDWGQLIPCRSAVAALSGGMDSVTMAHLLRERGVDLVTMSIDYGQRHRRELAFAAAAAGRLGVIHLRLDLRAIGGILGGSALTDAGVDVPDGHYTDESMRITVVPNRNAILLSLATAIAIGRGADAVAFAAHAGDHTIYPDCRPAFVESFTAMARTANEGLVAPTFQVVSPFIQMSKADIVAIGAELGVPWSETWSCYRGGDLHCGRCGTCVERREAFALAGVADPTVYEAGD